jgi:aspartyl/glutamyl-tRNA(Asn/Gln) amidotransferase C subunit
MASQEDVLRLAALARVSVKEEELGRLVEEFDGILAYVGKLDELTLTVGKDREVPALRNVFRDDEHPRESGEYTEKLVAQFPEKEGNLLKVRQVISHD